MTKSDKTSIIIGLTILVVGILLCIADFLWWNTSIKLWISIGCSLIASAVVVILNGFFVYRIKVSSLDSWKIHKIYEKRSFKDSDSDPAMKKMKEGFVDAIAFGLSSFRSNKIKIVDEL